MSGQSIHQKRVDFLSRYGRALDEGTEPEQLRCVVCGFQCNHFIAVTVNRGGDVVHLHGRDGAERFLSLPIGRGSVVWLEFVCEAGHHWAQQLWFRKGIITYTAAGLCQLEPDQWPVTFWRD